MWFYILAFVLLTGNALAQNITQMMDAQNSNTIVYGQAAQADGDFSKFTITQAKDAPNPLGDPIPNYSQPLVIQKPQSTPQAKIDAAEVLPKIQGRQLLQSSKPNPQPSEMSPQEMNQEIQNKIYEENDRLYDIQSYPLDDLDYLNQNNQDNAITNYPAY